MKDVEGIDRTLEQLLSGAALGIDYYQREYQWGRKQVQELTDDLHDQFLETYNEAKPGKPLKDQSKYFLGPIVVSESGNNRNLVDGQQRVTTLTLILIHLNHLQVDNPNKVSKVKNLIFDEEPDGEKFKLDIPDRNECMSSLLNHDTFDPEGKSESVKNLVYRYNDIKEIFASYYMSEIFIPKFIWWIMRNVKLIEITAHDEGDAYTIFETMNDRGLSLTPTDMLRGYLLAKIENHRDRTDADNTMKHHISRFNEFGKETVSDFFKVWLRSQYAETIRDREKDAKAQDFEKIGTEYHRWIRDNRDIIMPKNDFHKFIKRDMSYFADRYNELLSASANLTKNLESIKFNMDAGFTLQHHMILAGITADDDVETATAKMKVVADFIDIWLNLRLWNYKSNGYSAVQYTIFKVILDIRHKSLQDLRKVLHARLLEEFKDMNFDTPIELNRRTSRNIHRQLARITDWLERKSDRPGRYEEYIVRSKENAYEVEHIWANHYDRFSDVFDHEHDFDRYRNKIGGLVLLPRKQNSSLSDKTYEEKLNTYNSAQNLLAASLHNDFYQSNPAFYKVMHDYSLAFRPLDKFGKKELDERSNLYCHLAQHIWSPDRLLDDE